jgi:hypothetical protein
VTNTQVPFASHFSATDFLPRLMVHQNENVIRNEFGQVVVLRGVSLPDFKRVRERNQIKPYLRNHTMDHAFVFDQMFAQQLTPTVVRLWVSTNMFGRYDEVASEADMQQRNEEYLTKYLDPAVEYCIRHKLYCIIDWHYISDYDDPNVQRSTANFWLQVAPRYAHIPNVIYELFNEPVRPDDWEPWQTTAQPWIDLIRSHADNLLLVGGPFWNFRVAAVIDPTKRFVGSNLAYVMHIYPIHGRAVWHTVKQVAAVVPLFLTEWGYDRDSNTAGQGGTRTNWGEGWRDFVDRELPHVSWTGWIFDYSFTPRMVELVRQPNQPLRYKLRGGDEHMGEFIRDWLSLNRSSSGV